MRSRLEPASSHSDDHWIPLSDLMTGLMMVFLLVAIVYMVKLEADSQVIRDANVQIAAHSKRIEEQSDRIKQIAILYDQMKTELAGDLKKEFEMDLAQWDAELAPDGTIRFKAPEVLFDSKGPFQVDLKPRFQAILRDFFPRYVEILYSDKYRDVIEEVRIEGHTSSFWQQAVSEQEAYFRNMSLSQDRTRKTLEYVMGLPTASERLRWLRERVTANGLSYSRRIFNADGSENFARSQRVEFRVRTDSESRMGRIIENAK
jgi:outer membrane protein OmpA-like peptidoglycan-associated protein